MVSSGSATIALCSLLLFAIAPSAICALTHQDAAGDVMDLSSRSSDRDQEQMIVPVRFISVGSSSAPIDHLDRRRAKREQGDNRPRSSSARHSVTLKAFGKDYEVFLEPNDHVLYGDATPIFLAKGAKRSNGKYAMTYERRKFLTSSAKTKLYHNRSKRAALTIHEDEEGFIHIDGLLGDDLSISSIPPRSRASPDHHMVTRLPGLDFHGAKGDRLFDLLFDELGKGLFPSNIFSDSFGSMRPWIVQTPNKAKSPSTGTGATTNTNTNANSNTFTTGVPGGKFVYPQILVTMDYETYESFGKNVNSIARYMLAFWNAVDLRYRELDSPKVRLNIAGLVIPTNREASAHLSHNLDSTHMIQSTGLRFAEDYRTFPFESYDIVAGFLHGKKLPNSGSTVGVANVGKACKNYLGLSVELIADTGSFGSVHVAAHELGHNLGIYLHDEECPDYQPSYLMEGNIDGSFTDKSIRWSRCSKRQLSKFLTSASARCLYNRPSVGKHLPKSLPGNFMSRDEQCKNRAGPKFAVADGNESNCTILLCSYGIGNFFRSIVTQTAGIPAEGTSCGYKKICIDGQCVSNPN